MPSTQLDLEVACFFRENYIVWAVGELDPVLERELDALSPRGWENWKAVMEREYGMNAGHIRNLHALLCESAGLSRDEALAAILRAE